MRVLVMMVGLPRSGKSTIANLLRSRYHWPIVCPDSVRLALTGQPFVRQAEGFVWATTKVMVRSLFLSGHDRVILDATNLKRRDRDSWYWPKEFLREVHVVPTSKEVCLERAGEDTALREAIERMAENVDPIHPEEWFRSCDVHTTQQAVGPVDHIDLNLVLPDPLNTGV